MTVHSTALVQDSFAAPPMLQLAMDSASHVARDQLAQAMDATVRGASQRYVETVLTPQGVPVEEGFARVVAEQVTEELLQQGVITDKRSSPIELEDANINVVFVRTVMDLENMVEATVDEIARRVEWVRERAEEASEELRSLIAEGAAQHQTDYEHQIDMPEFDREPDIGFELGENLPWEVWAEVLGLDEEFFAETSYFTPQDIFLTLTEFDGAESDFFVTLVGAGEGNDHPDAPQGKLVKQRGQAASVE